HYGPGPCVGEVPGDCDPAGYQDPFGPFGGDPPDPEDDRGFGPGSDEGEGLLQPSETPKAKGSEGSKDTPIPGKEGSEGKEGEDAGENSDTGKGGDDGKGSKP
ncbi:hypothetical protein ACFLXI_03645, partial [Chloroflexota bacterium]